MYEQRNFAIFSIQELPLIDFSQVLETSAETVRTSVDGSLTFVKWEGNPPECVENLTTKGEYITYSEMLEVLSSDIWSTPMDLEDV